MLENLIQLVKEQAGDAIINNPAIPNEHNNAAIESAASGIMDALKNQMGSGGMESLTALFSGGNAGQSSVLQSITQHVSGNLTQKFGLDSSAAGSIAQSLIPGVMNKLVQKTNDPNDSSFDLNGIFGALTTGGASANIGGMLGKIFG